jgi:hypothetical protein
MKTEAIRRGLSFEPIEKGQGVEYGFSITDQQKTIYGGIYATKNPSRIYHAMTESMYKFFNSNGAKNFLIIVDMIENHYLVIPFEVLRNVFFFKLQIMTYNQLSRDIKNYKEM